MSKAKAGERLPYLLAKLKAPRVLERLEQTAERARNESWPYEQFLETLLEAEVFARDASGARTRIRHAAFPGIEDARGLRLVGPALGRTAARPAPGAAELDRGAGQRLLLRAARHRQESSRLSRSRSRPAERGFRVAFATAQEWVSRLEAAQDRNQLETEAQATRALPPARRRRGRLPAPGTPGRRTCSSRSSPAATNAARSSSPPTAASSNGARSSATPWSPPPSSTGSSTTPP